MVLTGSELSQHEHNIRTCFCMQYSTSSVCDLFRQGMYRNLLEGTCAIILPSACLYHFQWLTTQEPSWPHARDRSIAEDSEHFADTWEHLRSVYVCMCVYVCLHACPYRTYVDNLYYTCLMKGFAQDVQCAQRTTFPVNRPNALVLLHPASTSLASVLAMTYTPVYTPQQPLMYSVSAGWLCNVARGARKASLLVTCLCLIYSSVSTCYKKLFALK